MILCHSQTEQRWVKPGLVYFYNKLKFIWWYNVLVCRTEYMDASLCEYINNQVLSIYNFYIYKIWELQLAISSVVNLTWQYCAWLTKGFTFYVGSASVLFLVCWCAFTHQLTRSGQTLACSRHLRGPGQLRSWTVRPCREKKTKGAKMAHLIKSFW